MNQFRFLSYIRKTHQLAELWRQTNQHKKKQQQTIFDSVQDCKNNKDQFHTLSEGSRAIFKGVGRRGCIIKYFIFIRRQRNESVENVSARVNQLETDSAKEKSIESVLISLL